jgi:outer membrane protein OmpA-like peptidoglycan-associated protein
VSGLNHQRDAIEYGAEGTWYCYIYPTYQGCPYYGKAIPGEIDGNQQPQIERYEDFQEEIRMTSNDDGPLKYMLGGDYFNWRWLEDYAGFGVGSNQRTRALAAFGSVGYTFFDQLTLGVEARYNSDQITYTGFNGPVQKSAQATYDRFLPRFTADYQFTPDIMLYGVISEGNHPGTFNNPSSTDPSLVNVREEILWNYEAGIKSEWFDHKLRVNLAAYHEDWTNQQLLEYAQYFSNVTHSLQSTELLTNAGGSHIDGVELEVDALPVDGLNIRGTLAYDNAVFDQFCSPQEYAITGLKSGALPCGSVAGKTLPQQPPLTMSLLVSYTAPLIDDWNYFVIGDWSYLDKKYADETNLTWTPVSNIVNLRAGVDDGALRIEGFIDNLTQEDAPVRASTRLDYQLLASPYGAYNTDEVPQKPRQFGVKVTYKFGGESEPEATPAAYVPPPVVAPAPSVPKSYLVFFDFNKSDLTPQAVSIVNLAASNAGPAKVTQLTVTGHTDTVGSDAYNMRLSRRRAESVAAQLEKDGIPSSEIAIVAKGKRDLLVPTADGVKEPQNRRVQIVYDGGSSS